MLYRWNPTYEVGVPAIDGQHLVIFDLANALHRAESREGDSALVETALVELSEYVETHFDDEEALMRREEYPAYEEHRQIHRDMRRKVQDLAERFAAGDVRPAEIHFLVVSWLMKHIAHVDLRVAEYLEARKAA